MVLPSSGIPAMREYNYPPKDPVPCFPPLDNPNKVSYFSNRLSFFSTFPPRDLPPTWGLVLYYLNLPPIIYPNSTDKPSTSLNNYLSPLKRASVLRTDVLIYLRKEYLHTEEEIQTEDQRKDIWLLGIMLFFQKPFS